MKLIELIENQSITWIKPDFEYEWKAEADHLKLWTKSEFLTLMQTGKLVSISTNKIDNFTPSKQDWETLDSLKRKRVKFLFASDKVEAPIILFFKNKKYLLSGNTRLNYAMNNGYDSKAWMVEFSKIQLLYKKNYFENDYTSR